MKREEWLHHEWLSLLEISGPFLSVEVLKERLPQGLESIDVSRRRRLRVAYDEWDEACRTNDPDLEALHGAWVEMVMKEALEYEEGEFLHPRGDEFTYAPIEHDGSVSADFAIAREGEERPDLFILVLPPGTDLERIPSSDGWPANVFERAIRLCRDKEVRFALVTNGERWALVDAPIGSVSSVVSWYARIWFQEPVTLRAFRTLLGVSRLYGSAEGRLAALLDESRDRHEEVTDTLGEQVRRAIEVLVQSLDRADRDRNRELLENVEAKTLYEAGLTVMMRLVFVLSAEERGLLLLGDPVYDRHYAVSTLRSQLSEEADRYGAEILERRHDAWSRLLAVFRMVYAGVEHESMRMPALGGSLFDPDRFPFLEGRTEGSRWTEEAAKPLPIDDRTVLLLLEALQVLKRKGGALRLSYKALDVEQIGHVYEGLLEYTVVRTPELTLALRGSKNAKRPTVALRSLEAKMAEGVDEVAKALKEITGRSLSALKNDLRAPVDEKLHAAVILACGGDVELAERVRPFANLLAVDAWGEPKIYEEGSFAVVPGNERSATGAHYTPKALTESVVATTLEPILYEGPAEGKPKEEWKLLDAEEIVSSRICDPAMGSGAFLVQACRYLAERLVEAWGVEESRGRFVTAKGEVVDVLVDEEPLPTSMDDRLVLARRLVAERCLYGVDLNPLAVELAKLSLWLVTLSKGRPFGFLDHSLRVGDSLLGVDDVDKLVKFSMEPEKKLRPTLFGHEIEEKVREALRLRDELRSICVVDMADVEAMERLDAMAKERLSVVEVVADAMMGEVLVSGGNRRELQRALDALSSEVAEALAGDEKALRRLEDRARGTLSTDLPAGASPRKPFHWALEFPEVFADKGGFDAIVGNPPFLGGRKITTHFGKIYRDHLVHFVAEKDGAADLVAYFFDRAFEFIRERGTIGFLATNSIAEGDTRIVGLEKLLKSGGTIYSAYPNEPWPGNAAVVTSRIHIVKNDRWNGGYFIDGEKVSHITSYLSAEDDRTPSRLISNVDRAFQGSIVLGKGFILEEEEAKSLLRENERNSDVLYPYLNGKDLNSSPTQSTERWVVQFWDWSKERCIENHPKVFAILEERVKPERLEKKGKAYEKARIFWWRHFNERPALYHAIGRGALFENHPKGDWPEKAFEEVLVFTLHTKFWSVSSLKNEFVFTHALGIFAFYKKMYLALLQSSFHEKWAWKQSSKMGASTMRYTITDCFETFPFPEALDPDWRKVDFFDPIVARLEDIGERYHERRKAIMLERQVGLTDLYNLFHDPEVGDADIEELRRLHVKMDEAVRAAYGWDDLDLGHDFHEVPYLPEKDRVRYTVSETARLEILKRLLDLNEERHRQEVETSLLDKKSGRSGKKRKSDGGLF